MKLDFFRLIFEKYSYQISRKLDQWELSCSLRVGGRKDVQTDRHGDADGRFSQFCELAQQSIGSRKYLLGSWRR